MVDLFCGSGRNLACLESMGFKNLHGVDLSPRLLHLYIGKAKLYVGDATSLNFPDDWADIVIVQGGLHHLPLLPNDLAKCLDQIQRVLKPDGILIIVEPWLTPFLVFAHWCCRQRFLRKLSSKLDALAVMVEEEKETYFAWLAIPEIIANELKKRFFKLFELKGMGKINFVGKPLKN